MVVSSVVRWLSLAAEISAPGFYQQPRETIAKAELALAKAELARWRGDLEASQALIADSMALSTDLVRCCGSNRLACSSRVGQNRSRRSRHISASAYSWSGVLTTSRRRPRNRRLRDSTRLQ